MKNLISNIKLSSKILENNTEEELDQKINKIKKRAKIEGLDKVLVDWFALVQEISFRKKWINRKLLTRRINFYGKSDYSSYLTGILKE